MKFLLPLLFLALSANAQVAILHVNLSFTNRAEALTFRTQVKGVSDSIQGVANNPTEAAWTATTNTLGGVKYSLAARRAFASTNDVLTVLNFFKTNAFPATMTGVVSIHRCPADGANIANWLGCKDDPRAQYREKTWP